MNSGICECAITFQLVSISPYRSVNIPRSSAVHYIVLNFVITENPLLRAFAKLRKATVSFVMSVCLSARSSVRIEQLASRWTDFHEILYSSIFSKIVEKFQFWLNPKTTNGTAHEDKYTFYVTSRSVLLRIKSISHKSRRETRNILSMFSKLFF